VLPLRHAVLRTGRPWADAHYLQDDEPSSAHFAAFGALETLGAGTLGAGTLGADDAHELGAVLGVGSVLPEPPEWREPLSDATNAHCWRVRGMATRQDLRGSGLGSRILASLLDHAKTEGGGLVWCTARIGASTFYERAGFIARGGIAHVPGIGPHRTMWLEIDQDEIDQDDSPHDRL
jgi:GNAT superfamily N-acetyltransferase